MSSSKPDKQEPPMPAQKGHSSLFDFLQSLYTWFVRHLYVQKLDSYRPASAAGLRKSVIKQLQQHIERPHEAKHNSVVADSCPPGQVCKPATGREISPENRDSGLGQSFHDRHLAGAHHGMAEKLVKSAWEHLHTSMRTSAAGDRAAAKLHLDILDSALTELAHFIPEDEYRSLLDRMETELRRIGET